MPARLVAFLTLAFLLAVLFVRLGFWQLARLQERRAINAVVSAQLAQPSVPFDELRGDTAFRRVTVSGNPDVAHEILHVGRSRNGSPGVHILTPMLRPNSDTAVLVNRGWVYAPDAATADLARWRESRTSFSGFVMTLGDTMRGAAAAGRRVRQLSHATVQSMFQYPVAPVYVIAEDAGGGDSTPARIDRPALHDGPHLGYAIQWFSFAAIAIGGAIIVAIRARRADPAGATGA